MDEQGAYGKCQMEKENLQNMEMGSGHMGGVEEHCQDMQGCNKEDLRQDREQQERLLYVNSKRKKDYRKPGPTTE